MRFFLKLALCLIAASLAHASDRYCRTVLHTENVPFSHLALNDMLRFPPNEVAKASAVGAPKLLGYGEPVLAKYAQETYKDLKNLPDGQLIALMKVVVDRHRSDAQFVFENRQDFLNTLDEWASIKLSIAHSAAENSSRELRLTALEQRLVKEFTPYDRRDGTPVQPITADFKNMIAGARANDLTSEFPRYGVPPLFTVFFQRFLKDVKSSENEKTLERVDQFADKFLK